MVDTKPIKLLVPDIPDYAELEPFYRRIDRERRYTNFGPLTLELEQSIARLFSRQPIPCVTTPFETVPYETAPYITVPYITTVASALQGLR